jgi:hypothetical protein
VASLRGGKPPELLTPPGLYLSSALPVPLGEHKIPLANAKRKSLRLNGEE